LRALLSSATHEHAHAPTGARAHLGRWRRLFASSASPRSDSDDPRSAASLLLARLRFCPRVGHSAALALLRSVGDGFLDPFPWGAGVTSAEALEACLPVVTWPARVTVLQLALGQLRQLGLAAPGFLVARSAAEYAAIAVRLGADPAFRALARSQVCARRPRLFGAAPEVAAEWAAFLERVARPFL
jgi:predicted O-linked N-acetylglucosamine transferase (SPINDLY family)